MCKWWEFDVNLVFRGYSCEYVYVYEELLLFVLFFLNIFILIRIWSYWNF